MTASTLAAWLTLAILAQVAVFAVVAMRRRARERSAAAAAPTPASAPGMPAWANRRDFRVERRVPENRCGDVCSFYLVPVDGQPLPPFQPGQYLTFHLQIEDPQTRVLRRVVRCYSLSDRPDPKRYRVSIKRVPNGVSSNYFHDHVQEGTVLAVQAPGGHFTLAPSSREPVVLVAGGIGITPVLSMLKAALHDAPQREIWLFYAVRNGSEMVLGDELRDLVQRHAGFHLRVCFSQPDANDVEGTDFHHRGRLDVKHLRIDLPLRDFHFYVCGPGPMMETLLPAIEAWGVPPARLHYEAFGPASLSKRAVPAVPLPAAGSVDVTFSRSGKRLPWDGRAESILDLAESHGIAVNCGCRAGVCGSCETRIEAGEVTYTRPPEFDPSPGHCLLCVTVPKTALTLEL